MFDKDMQIHGKHARYWKSLANLKGNAVVTADNFKIFENYIHVYMVAPIIGLLNGRKAYEEDNDVIKDSAGMLAAIQIKYSSKLKYIYRLIILTDDSEGLSAEEKINRAFREDGNEESVKKGMELYEAYFRGGLEILYETFVEQCITDDDYIAKLYEFMSDFKQEQDIDSLSLDIDALLR